VRFVLVTQTGDTRLWPSNLASGLRDLVGFATGHPHAVLVDEALVSIESVVELRTVDSLMNLPVHVRAVVTDAEDQLTIRGSNRCANHDPGHTSIH
jgi:hypothetical protein